ncbi:hypothetical protein CYMTET_46153 [Cymbomonas tetramitiformis]|uniref:DNA-directed RNA polymerase RBP11-like dimerisation domain-containing protein n=1 Tax=Cymbomonas tetramitiformis TaxID=36881 RepID=A0AAE0BYT0_9CHLO|nr:hypothetical protein CYMTET_46153 [Cymbomonas tetramitiformis]
MNAPNRHERFVVPEGEKKVEYVKDTKVQNAARFICNREDHTLGNIVRMQLHRDPNVTFSGYQIPHPLTPKVNVQVQTTKDSTPIRAFDESLTELVEEITTIKDVFQAELKNHHALISDKIRRLLVVPTGVRGTATIVV